MVGNDNTTLKHVYFQLCVVVRSAVTLHEILCVEVIAGCVGRATCRQTQHCVVADDFVWDVIFRPYSLQTCETLTSSLYRGVT